MRLRRDTRRTSFVSRAARISVDEFSFHRESRGVTYKRSTWASRAPRNAELSRRRTRKHRGHNEVQRRESLSAFCFERSGDSGQVRSRDSGGRRRGTRSTRRSDGSSHGRAEHQVRGYRGVQQVRRESDVPTKLRQSKSTGNRVLAKSLHRGLRLQGKLCAQQILRWLHPRGPVRKGQALIDQDVLDAVNSIARSFWSCSAVSANASMRGGEEEGFATIATGGDGSAQRDVTQFRGTASRARDVSLDPRGSFDDPQ